MYWVSGWASTASRGSRRRKAALRRQACGVERAVRERLHRDLRQRLDRDRVVVHVALQLRAEELRRHHEAVSPYHVGSDQSAGSFWKAPRGCLSKPTTSATSSAPDWSARPRPRATSRRSRSRSMLTNGSPVGPGRRPSCRRCRRPRCRRRRPGHCSSDAASASAAADRVDAHRQAADAVVPPERMDPCPTIAISVTVPARRRERVRDAAAAARRTTSIGMPIRSRAGSLSVSRPSTRRLRRTRRTRRRTARTRPSSPTYGGAGGSKPWVVQVQSVPRGAAGSARRAAALAGRDCARSGNVDLTTSAPRARDDPRRAVLSSSGSGRPRVWTSRLVDDPGLLAVPRLGGHAGVAEHGLLHLVRLGARQLGGTRRSAAPSGAASASRGTRRARRDRAPRLRRARRRSSPPRRPRPRRRSGS